jgi:hypothetical protein
MDSLEHREVIYLHHMPLERVRAHPFPTLLACILLFLFLLLLLLLWWWWWWWWWW